MKHSLILIFILSAFQPLISQNDYSKELIELAKIYRKYHFSNQPPKKVFKQIKSIKHSDLKLTKKFLKELIKVNNKIIDKKYLYKPDSITLKSLYIIKVLNTNMYEDEPKDHNLVVDSLMKENTDYNELLSCYYQMIFTAVGNKNRPFDMAKVNFNMEKYNLKNDVEKGIFFLESMETFGTLIWGYMNIPNPPNYEKAMKVINKYPKYNDEPYYQYLDLNFKDFLLTTDKRKPKESFKKHYLNKYMNTILYHAMCLSQNSETRSEMNKILISSIIKNESYWKYSEMPEVFENIFKKVKE